VKENASRIRARGDVKQEKISHSEGKLVGSSCEKEKVTPVTVKQIGCNLQRIIRKLLLILRRQHE
jgi:hypothetical protein